ncbi:MAG: metallophosphoesterase [Kofleriaceae bacterium]
MTPRRWALLIAIAGCHREAPPPAATVARPSTGAAVAGAAPAAAADHAASAVAAAPPPRPGCDLAEVPARLPAAPRVVAIGDVHGDLAATRAALRAAGAIDAADAWIGGDLVVVQLGDVLDRGDDEQAILDLFERLEPAAAAAGGRFVWLLGNHELMNAALDFRYVTPGALHDFDDAPGVDPGRAPSEVPAAVRGRVAALAPGGAYAKVMADQNVLAKVGDTLFAHAGPVGAWATRIDAANDQTRCWLAGKAGAEPPPAVVDDEGPVWTRAWGGDEVDCTALAGVLRAAGATRLVVGHTVQDAGITSACGGALWRIDVGLSRYYQGPIQVLELTAKGPAVVSGSRTK